jgi:hypothetical protein
MCAGTVYASQLVEVNTGSICNVSNVKFVGIALSCVEVVLIYCRTLHSSSFRVNRA